MPFRPEDYADQRPSRDDYEPVYPDGTPKYECWNSTRLTPRKPATASLTNTRKQLQ